MKQPISHLVLIVWLVQLGISHTADAQELQPAEEPKETVTTIPEKPVSFGYTRPYDDKAILENYAEKYSDLSMDILLALIKDDQVGAYKSAAAVRVFRQKYSREVVSTEKKIIEKVLWRRLNRSDSAFVQVEVMHTLCIMDRYRYFKSLAPALLQKLDHFNPAVSEISALSLNDLIDERNNRAREARIVFNTLRKNLFLSRKRLAGITEPDAKLKQKLHLLRWSIKVLGSQELKRLPKEVINLL